MDNDNEAPSSSDVYSPGLSGKDNFATTIFDSHSDLTLIVGHAEVNDPGKRLLVCSRALARASPVFDRMLFGSLAESQRSAAHEWIVRLPEDAPEEMELFCYITHGLIRKVPRVVTQDQLVQLTLLTHYYDATLALAPWVRQWLAAIPLPVADDEMQLFQILWTSYELGQRRTFESTARRLVLDCPMSTDRLELQEILGGHLSEIISRVDMIRIETVRSMLELFRELTDVLVVVDEKPRWCRHASYMGPHRCESMILGSVVFCLTRANLWPIPAAQDVCKSLSVMRTYKQLANIVIHDIGQPEKNGKDHTQCNPRGFLLERLQRALANMADPLLEGHRGAVEDRSHIFGSSN